MEVCVHHRHLVVDHARMGFIDQCELDLATPLHPVLPLCRVS
jgi:hypothetical protein